MVEDWSRQSRASRCGGCRGRHARAHGASVAAPIGPLEKPTLTLGLAVDGSNFAAVYVAAARLWQEMGLKIEMTSFRGDRRWRRRSPAIRSTSRCSPIKG